MGKFLLAISFLVVFCSQAHSAILSKTIYVTAGNSDSNSGSTSASAVGSLARAQTLVDEFFRGYSATNFYSVRIVVSGMFRGQSFQWLYAYQNADLTLEALTQGAATFDGHDHPNWSNPAGTTFFSAYGAASRFASGAYSGFGPITIRNLTIKYYGAGVVLYATPGKRITRAAIQGNTFYRVGQVANPTMWSPLYAAIKFNGVDSAQVSNNRFIQIANNTTVVAENPDKRVIPGWMHGIYIVDSNRNSIDSNSFDNNSGPPVKIRDSSDYNVVSNNRFIRGSYSDHYFPVQSYYDGWYLANPTELPSFGNALNNNTFENGYVSTVFQTNPTIVANMCENRTFAVPKVRPQSYLDAAAANNTSALFIINGVKIYHTHWYQLCPNLGV